MQLPNDENSSSTAASIPGGRPKPPRFPGDKELTSPHQALQKKISVFQKQQETDDSEPLNPKSSSSFSASSIFQVFLFL